MSLVCCLMLTLAWADEPATGPKPEPTAAEKCLTKPISCCFKDVSLQEACEWFEYLMCVKITIDDDAMRQARGDEGRHASLEAESMPFEEVLDKLLKPMGLAFEANDKGIHIMMGTVTTEPPAAPTTDDEVPYSEEEPAKEEEPDGVLGGGVIGGAFETVVGNVPYSEEEPAKEETTEAQRGQEKETINAQLLERPFILYSQSSKWLLTFPKNEKEIEERLQTRISFKTENCPFRSALDSLYCVFRTNIVFDKPALLAANIDLAWPVSLDFKDMSMKCILERLLEQVDLTYWIKDDAIVITTEAAARGAETLAPTASPQIHWFLDYNVARKKAEAKDRPLLIYFYADYSVYCQNMFKKTFQDAKLVRTIKKHFVALKMDGEKDGKLAGMLRIASYPTTIVAGPDGKILDTFSGYMDAPAFLEKLQGVIKSVARAEENRFLDSITGGDEAESQPPDNQATIERKLTRPISVNFQKAPLESVCRDLQNLTGINIVVDKSALAAANVGLDQPLSLNVENISMKCVLNLLLMQATLTYQIKDDALVITTEAAARGPIKPATYSIRKLLESNAIGKVLNTPDSGKAGEDKLIHLITTTIAPESWESQGGWGAIQFFPGEKALVIRQVQDVHEQIADLFTALENYELADISRSSDKDRHSADGQLPSVVYAVADLVTPADGLTPVVCQMLDKPFQERPMDNGSNACRTLERDLIKLITTKIDPDSWECAGGCGKIQYFPLGMSLVVVNTKEVQKKVADFLQNLRQLQDRQDKEYVLEMKLVQAQEDADPKEFPLPRVTMLQGRWFTMFQGKTVTLKEGTIQDLLANGPEKEQAVLLEGSRTHTKKVEPTDDDVLVGVVIRGKVTTLASKLVRLDLVIQRNELDSASRDDIVVVGNSVRSAQRIGVGESFNHILEEDAEGTPLVWLEVRVTTPTADVKPPVRQDFRGLDEPIPRP